MSAPSPASPSITQGLEARQIALHLLRLCVERKLTVEDAIASDARAAKLPLRDRAFLSTLLLTAFRHRGEIGAVIDALLAKPLPRKSGPAREILELGVAQLLFLDMAPHAVIDLAVRSAKDDRNALHFSGLINAVLRKVAAGGAALLDGQDAARLNTPDWLWQRWAARYGEETARLIATAHAARPSLDISLKQEAGPWRASVDAEQLPNGQLRLPALHAPVPEIPGFAEGAWWVQDAAATIPVRLFGDVRGVKVLDLCAAPGGKTLQLAAMGAEVTAVDVSEPRLQRLRGSLARTGLHAEVVVQDMLAEGLAGDWDAVLLDAPCSATGTIRRHPELPYLKEPKQIRELSGLQRLMLGKAADLVRPGGMLVYCSCSLEPEEGENQIRKFLARDERFEILPASPAMLPAGAVAPEGWVRTLPFMSAGASPGMDGFFAVALRRRA